MVAPNPMTVKGSTNIQPATTNEALIMLFTQMESLQENMKTMMDDIKDIKEFKCGTNFIEAPMGSGKTDTIMMRIVDIVYSVPEILLIVVIKLVIDAPLNNLVNNVAFFKPLQRIGSGLLAIFIVYGCLYWVGMARIVRGQVLQLKEMEYVTAARALGTTRGRLIREHLLPNCEGQLIATVMLQIPSAIFTEAFLSFLGIGVNAPMASLGSLTSEALDSITVTPYRMIFPALLISMIILSFNLFGDGLRDALDPKINRK